MPDTATLERETVGLVDEAGPETLPLAVAEPATVTQLAKVTDRERVMFACVHSDQRHSTFDDSKDALVSYDRAHDQYLAHSLGRAFVRVGTDGLVAARNTVAQQLVDSDVDWLFWVDSDMGFAPDTLARLRAAADPVDRPIVGALCFASRQVAHDGLNGYRTRPLPTVYDWAEVDGQPVFTAQPVYPVDSLMQVAGTGSACILIHRTVLEKIERDWYTRIPDPSGKMLGEDISFCVRAGARSFPIWVDTSVKTSHVKPQWVAEADHWRALNPPYAVDRVAVIAPTQTPALRKSMIASTGLARLYRSTARATVEPWFFFAEPNHRFHPGWLDHAQHVAKTFRAAAVITNDLTDQRSTGVLFDAGFYRKHGAASLERAAADGLVTVALGSIVEFTNES